MTAPVSTTRLLMRSLRLCDKGCDGSAPDAKERFVANLRELANRLEAGEEVPEVELLDWGLTTDWRVHSGERSG